jgi:hypothetical protein
MLRLLFIIAGLFGVGLLLYDAIQYPWSPYLFTWEVWTTTWGLCTYTLVLIFVPMVMMRVWVITFMWRSFWLAVQWQHHLGAAEERILWSEDFSSDAERVRHA